MKVLLINNFFYRKGGSEAVFFNTAEALSAAGHEVSFFSIDNRENCEVREKAYFAPQLSGIKKALAYFYNAGAAKELDRVLEEWHPDIAHIHLFWGALSPSVIRTLHRHSVPVVHTAHDYRMVCPAYTFRNGKGEICEKCGKSFLPCVAGRCSKGSFLQSLMMAAEMRFRNTFFNPAATLDGIIYVSRFSKDIHESHNPGLAKVRNIVLHNSSDRIEKGESEDFFLYSGRLSAEKGCATMISAFQKMPRLRLAIAGEGPQETHLKAMSKCAGNISFKGYLQKEELFELVKKCKFVVVPSEWYENNPMSIVEAYSASKPVVAAGIGGIPEMVEEGKTGFLFGSGDVEGLCSVLEKCSELSPSEYYDMQKAAADKFSELSDKNKYTEQLLDFYKSVINDK